MDTITITTIPAPIDLNALAAEIREIAQERARIQSIKPITKVQAESDLMSLYYAKESALFRHHMGGCKHNCGVAVATQAYINEKRAIRTRNDKKRAIAKLDARLDEIAALIRK